MKKRKTVKKRYVIALVIVIAGLITLWRILNAPVPTYQTLIVRPGDLQQSVLATGKLDALRKVDVGAQVSGQLKTLSVAICACFTAISVAAVSRSCCETACVCA
ncbi:hypothetical protein ACUOFC_21265, partial [Escherichia sp. TWPC-MK]